jgi:hypothetical protein
VYEITTADGDDAIVITWLLGKDETHETGTTTGDDQVVGTTTVTGTETNDETLTETIALLGIVAIALDATDDGTFVYSTMANPDEIEIT